MGRVVGIICEYNPFHKGHKYQIDKIKSIENGATVIAIMSGNIVQRGEFAIIDKYSRAKMALECGIDAVFELPYPYSGSTAEIFASAGVELAYRVGCDAIYFGTELLSLEELERVASAVDSAEFETEINDLLKDKSIGYIGAKEKALERLGVDLPQSANDMLGVEYIRAIKKMGKDIEYHTVQRVGSFYNDERVGNIMSAGAIRKSFYKTNSFASVPLEAMPIYDEVLANGRYLNLSYVNDFLQTYTLLNSERISSAFDTTEEMVALIKEKSKNSKDFITDLSSKAFTNSRLKRTVLYSLFEIENVDFALGFTVLLGMNKKGQAHINKIKKNDGFYIITKHSDGKDMPNDLKAQLEKLYYVDSVYNTLMVKKLKPSEAFRNKPIITE